MNGWLFLGLALWFLLTFIGTITAVTGIGCDDNELVRVLAVFGLAAAITSWAMFIGFCMHMGGAL
ncbi:hypothetical protein BBM1128_02160 [Bifidobacterium breve MCC 1128]|uniref:Uncharacterized protein n=1 Tax=Bifidobacterium breve MCC 1128 TaxID=1365965 RepID=A0A0L7B658_BIFBR|nr:hypothetical protein BBM1128_02160 [Bifidobacterium breve MCC 1128]